MGFVRVGLWLWMFFFSFFLFFFFSFLFISFGAHTTLTNMHSGKEGEGLRF